MRGLVVHAHPLDTSLTRHFCDRARAALAEAGHAVDFLDLYPAGFDPCLTSAERAAYNLPRHDHSDIAQETAQLRTAEMLVLVFPTWWFGLPAILKGYIDRVFAPGVAFARPETTGGMIRPLLTDLRHVMAVTTLGSPWWIETLAMRRPVRHQLKNGVMRACAPKAQFHYLPFHSSEAPSQKRVDAFAASIARRLASLS